MAKVNKVLFITQEMVPYVEDSLAAKYGRQLSQGIQDAYHEIRSFMPKWGGINERRNQLHEVIRLSGMNMILDDTDHPLIIKVASITAARMQVYFIDNDDYFGKRQPICDEQGVEYADNAERAVFYARGVLETVKKLKWVPDVIHCQGWISSIVPLYVKKAYHEEPSFRDAKVVYTPTHSELCGPLPERLSNILNFKGAGVDDLVGVEGNMDMQTLTALAMKYADGIALMEPDEKFQAMAEATGKPLLMPQNLENIATVYDEFFDKISQK